MILYFINKKDVRLFDIYIYICYNVSEMAHYSSQYSITKTRVKYRYKAYL